MNSIKAFQDAVLVRNVTARFKAAAIGYSDEELAILAIIISLKPSYRAKEIEEAKLGPYTSDNPDIKSLISKGLLKTNRSGAISVVQPKADNVLKEEYVPEKYKKWIPNPGFHFKSREAGVRDPKEIAHRAAWSEKSLIKDLEEAGAELVRVKELPDRAERQFFVRWPNGDMGYYYPGGPAKRPAYSYTEGSIPGDASKPAMRWPTPRQASSAVKQANASKWLAEVDQLGIDDVEGNYRHDAKLARGYIAKCKYLNPIFRALAGPMMTPVIGEFADRMDQRVQDVEKLMILVQAGVKLAKKVQKEFDDFIDEVAEGRNTRSSGLIEAVHDLPSTVELFKIAEEAGELQDKMSDEDESGHIDWTLEDYLGGEAKVYHKIENASSGMSSWSQDEFGGARVLYGFIKYLTDPEYIQGLVQEARENLEIE